MPRSDRSRFNADRPNIVFIHAESMDGRKMRCMGHAASVTPNLDSLAEDGVLFTNAYSTCPVCNPSRASMWSGKYPHVYECWNNHEGLHDHVPTFRDTFDRAGYLTEAIGPLDYQWGKHSIRDRIGSWTRTANIQRPISRTPLPRIDDGDPWGADWQRAWQAIDFMREASSRDRPFMLYLTTGLVHPAFIASTRYMELIDQDAIEIPPDLGPLEDTEHPVMRYMRITKNCDTEFPEQIVREMRHMYFAMIATLDELVGQVLAALEDLGLRESTYVIFSSDHGEMAGEHNQILKRSMYEPSIHVPLIASGPDVCRGGQVDAPVSLIDIYPTLMDMARLSYDDCAHHPGYPERLDGESLMPQLTTDAPRQREWAFAQYNGDRCNTGAYMLRRGQWKYVKYIGYEPQLFDLNSDPWEVENLAGTRPEVVEELDGILEASFDCAAIDAAARAYGREAFLRWSEQARADGTYERTMAHVYSGFDRQCIEDLMPWTAEDEAQIQRWLAEG
ncbi:MAG: sulfatase-like hydrolase/transferase [Armatimonadota bacterium]|nr:sulfatase-like hydrolase/transferase [Armatimonadota bacterium]